MIFRSFKCLQKVTEIEHKLRSFNRRILELEHIKQVKSLAALSSARTLVSQGGQYKTVDVEGENRRITFGDKGNEELKE